MTVEPIRRLLLLLAPLALLIACSESRDLPSAPSITAHPLAAERLEVPSPQGYPLLAHDPIKHRVWLIGGFTTDGALIYDLWAFNTRSRMWTQVVNTLGPTSWDAVALDVQSRKIIVYQGYTAAFDAVDVETWAYDVETGVWEEPASDRATSDSLGIDDGVRSQGGSRSALRRRQLRGGRRLRVLH